MSLIQVADFRLDAERREQAPSAYPEQHFLFEAQLRASSVKLAGNAPMRGIIRCVVAVQQVQLDATDLNLPGAQPDRVTGQGDLQPQPLPIRFAQRRDRQLARVVIRIKRLLSAILIEDLTKIALLI